MKKKILITGSTGMLGADIIRLFQESQKFELYGMGRSLTEALPESHQLRVDFSGSDNERWLNFEPHVVIHTAALTDLNMCEHNPALARKINVDASLRLASECRPDTHFFYISTDSVFDGKKGNYSETDKTDPLNVYAQTKLAGERAVVQNNRGKTVIVRTNIYGLHTPPKNSLAEWAIAEWKKGNTISGFSDVIFNAVFTGQLASVLDYLITTECNVPILNVGSVTHISKFDFLDSLRKRLNVSKDKLNYKQSVDFQSTIARPKNTSLNTSLLASLCAVPSFDEGIDALLEQAKRSML